LVKTRLISQNFFCSYHVFLYTLTSKRKERKKEKKKKEKKRKEKKRKEKKRKTE
jgi:hypothetical protein